MRNISDIRYPAGSTVNPTVMRYNSIRIIPPKASTVPGVAVMSVVISELTALTVGASDTGDSASPFIFRSSFVGRL